MLKKLIDWFTDDNVVIKDMTHQYFEQETAPKPLIDGDGWLNTKTNVLSAWNSKKETWEPVPIFDIERDEEGRWVQ